MPYSHHSHSGQFCPGHAQDQLEDIIQAAIAKKMEVFCLSEHMPRHDEDLYPEELEDGWNITRHLSNEAAYFKEAVRLRDKYANQINILVGFECDWIRPESKDLILQSLSLYPFDFFIGSVHHVHTFPVDWDTATYHKAREASGGSTDDLLYEDYFDDQLRLMQQLKPPIIGHFDLIRLKSDDPDASFKQWPGVWQKVLRNLAFAASYGALIELNFAAVRKGMKDPYPASDICKEYLALNGRFCLSDDSHGIAHLATNYDKLPAFLEKTGITKLHHLFRPEESSSSTVGEPLGDSRFPNTRIVSKDVTEVHKSEFWQVLAKTSSS